MITRILNFFSADFSRVAVLDQLRLKTCWETDSSRSGRTGSVCLRSAHAAWGNTFLVQQNMDLLRRIDDGLSSRKKGAFVVFLSPLKQLVLLVPQGRGNWFEEVRPVASFRQELDSCLGVHIMSARLHLSSVGLSVGLDIFPHQINH